MFRVLFLAMMFFCAQSSAQQVGPKSLQTQVVNSSGGINLLSSVALNASSSARTVTVNTNGYKNVTLCFQTTRAAYTSVSVTPTCSVDGGTTYSSIPSTFVDSGVGTNTAYSDTINSSVSFNMCLIYDINSCDKMKFVFAGTGAGSSDTVTAQARVGVSP